MPIPPGGELNLSVALVEILVGIAAGNVAMFLGQHHIFGLR
jgi:hypothetical protein